MATSCWKRSWGATTCARAAAAGGSRPAVSGRIGKIAYVELCCYWHMRNRDTLAAAPDTTPPPNLDYEMWTGPAPMRPYNKIVRVFCQSRSMRSGSEIMISIAARAAAALAGLMDALNIRARALCRRKSMVAASDAM